MAIQWFPGHMTTARKKAAETMAQIDVVVEVLDARLPEAGSNPMIHELRTHRQRPCLKLLNKADLADPEATRAWLDYFNKQPGVMAVAISAKKPGDVAKLPALAQKLAPHRDDTFKPLRLMIMGIPNVGKSTLMNALVKRRVAAVGDEPAVTKSQQRINLSPRLTLVDTPGMTWPKIEHDCRRLHAGGQPRHRPQRGDRRGGGGVSGGHPARTLPGPAEGALRLCARRAGRAPGCWKRWRKNAAAS